MKSFFKKFALFMGFMGLCGVGGLVALYFWAARDLPGFKKITDYNPPLVTTVYAADDSILGYFYREKRFLRRLDQMPPILSKAFLAAEDSAFYEHEGIDLTAIARAMVKNIKAGGIVQGGSTITQQVIKRLLLTSEKSYERKLKEAILAYRLEHYLNKDEILTIYLNQIYLGAGAYGVEAAARIYFGKHVAELNLAECAVLAGLPQAPSKYNPYRDPAAAKVRQRYVLQNLLALNWITREEYDKALDTPLVYRRMEDPSWRVGAYYLEEVRRWLIDYLSEENVKKLGLPLTKYGEDAVYESGLHVHTAIKLDHQAAAEQAVRDGLEASTRRRGWRGPVRHLEKGEYRAFLAGEGALPTAPATGEWVLVPERGKLLRAPDSLRWLRDPEDDTRVMAAEDNTWTVARGRGGATATWLMDPVDRTRVMHSLTGEWLQAPEDAYWIQDPEDHGRVVSSDKVQWLSAPKETHFQFPPKPDEWLQVLVEEVKTEGATVRAGTLTGFMDVATMHWCREIDPSKATDEVKSIKDATLVVKPGDVVWATLDHPDDKTIAQRRSKNPDSVPAFDLRFALQQKPIVQGALVSIEPDTGNVVALVGGYSFGESQFNRATQASRQPGSAFKPIVYSTAMDNGFTPASMVLDAPFVYTDFSNDSVWRPENFEGVFYGPTLLRTALAKSRNLVTIRVAQKIGIRKIIERAQAMGLEGQFEENLSVSLGSVAVTPLNMCQAYTTFARGGSWSRARIVLDAQTAWGEALYTSEPEFVEAMSPQTAYIMDAILKEVVRDGTGWRARVLKRPVAGKTGTTNDEQDAWYMGFAPYLMTSVYVGFDQITPMGKWETGSRAASPIWVQYRMAVEDQYPVQDFVQPPGVVNVRIDGDTGLLASPSSKLVYFLPFKEGTQPTRTQGTAPARGEDTSASGEELLKQVF